MAASGEWVVTADRVTVDDMHAELARCAPVLAAETAACEEQRSLTPRVVDALVDAGLFRLAVASDCGGLEATPAEQVRAVELLARVDGSIGWCALIGVSGGYVSGLLDRGVARELFGPRNAVMAGQIVPAARAERVVGGYRVSGRCRFASGINHATIINVGCAVFDRGQPSGVRSMLLSKRDVTVIENWDTTGMRATGSHDFVVDDVFVPDAYSFSALDPPQARGALYRFPPLFLVTHAGVPLGIAQGALDRVHELARSKETAGSQHVGTRSLLRDDEHALMVIAESEVALAACRALAYGTIEDLWCSVASGAAPSEQQRAMYRAMLVYIHRTCRNIVTELYDLAASSALPHGSPLDKALRDIQTACQHRVVQQKMYRFAGQLFTGLAPGDPFF